MTAGRRKGSVAEVFFAFLMLGLSSFGGPVAHLGYFRTAFVERRRWLGDAAYAELVALCQFLPGPASSQVGIALGLMRAGLAGALAAWIGFTLPSALLLVAFASGLGGAGLVSHGLVAGLKIAALAVVAQAVLAMIPALAPDRTRRLIALGAAILLLAYPGGWQQVGTIALSALVGALLLTVAPRPPGTEEVVLSKRLALAFLALFLALLVGLPVAAALFPNPALDVIDRFYRAGSLVFGGGHVVLPLLSEALVAPGLVSADTFLAGYGAAQAVPGPLFSFAAYLGFVLDRPVGGFGGAALALASIYLPSFLLVFAALPFWGAIAARPRARAGLAGANAGVLGVLGAALYSPVFMSTVTAPRDLALALAAFAALALLRAPPWLVVLACGAVGFSLG